MKGHEYHKQNNLIQSEYANAMKIEKSSTFLSPKSIQSSQDSLI